ncbi:uncharacterized protein J7T54_005129 [Emericellopsis cladophorae]|uniref:Xylanolytic transcriptional activator regulatory domain-containing protein n=1 Tax=Emericellopsis cladophorae TaxID=2686198 RepID=A0A9P9Y2U0_9HYPO|nr:uncharacterized protein J7T54_005129 [Emericellopsis cladophorae]KAI6781919.1 hypothetical protein J7T54_005129 [Emericellopsis cladophorae]
MYPKKLLALLAAPFLAQAAIQPGELVTIISAAGSTNQAAWWAPLDQYGGYDRFAYLRKPPGGSTSNNNVMVARRSMFFAEYAGHNTPSIAWNYFRSSAAYSSTLVDQSSEMPDQTAIFIYPMVKRGNNGDLYSTSSKQWTRVSIWAYNKGYSVYPDDIQFSEGDMHLQWEWSKYPASAVRHEGSYLRYRPSTDTYRTITGATVSLPVTESTADLIFQPLTSGARYGGNINTSPGPASQSAKLALYEVSVGTVHVSSGRRFKNTTDGAWQVRRATSIFGATSPWTREIIYAGVGTTASLGITHDGTTIRVYYLRQGDSSYVLEKTGNMGWTNTVLAPAHGKRVERLHAVMQADGVDILYLGSPTNVNSSTGSVYRLAVGGRAMLLVKGRAQFQRLLVLVQSLKDRAMILISVQSLLFLIQFATLNPSLLDVWYLVGVGMRICVDLGLHQDPRDVDKLSMSLLETLRRLCWSKVSFDHSMSIGCSRVQEITDAVINVALPTFSIETTVNEAEIHGCLQRYRILQIQSETYDYLKAASSPEFPDPATIVAWLGQKLSARHVKKRGAYKFVSWTLWTTIKDNDQEHLVHPADLE